LFFFTKERKTGINRKHYGIISLALNEGNVSVAEEEIINSQVGFFTWLLFKRSDATSV